MRAREIPVSKSRILLSGARPERPWAGPLAFGIVFLLSGVLAVVLQAVVP